MVSKRQKAMWAKLKAYDVKAKKKVNIEDPHAVQIGKGNRKVWAIKGKSSATGIGVYRIVGKKKPTI